MVVFCRGLHEEALRVKKRKAQDFELVSRAKALARPNSNGSLARLTNPPSSELIAAPSTIKKQLGLKDSFCLTHLKELDKKYANYVFEVGRSFLSSKHPALGELLEAAVEFGATTGRKNYKPPGRDRLKGSLLDVIDEEQETALENGPHGLHKATFGATFVSDGGTDRSVESIGS